MMHLYLRAWALLALLAGSFGAHAQLEPAAQYTKLTVAQLLAWAPTGPTAVPANVSRVPLASRQNSLPAQLNPAQSFTHKVNYIPDGMSGWSGYLNEQPRFNLYNFTHWQYIDVLTWFDGPVALPTRPWVETAHRNGVKVIGSVFLGTAADWDALVQKDANNNYIAAQKLIDLAVYYGFDGWFFNQETRVSVATATELRNLLKQAQLLKPAGLEMHWYDSMLPSGAISYQNALNTNNQLLFQEGTARVSDAMFTNYFWSGPANITTSVNTATALGRSPFEVYMGADLWPNRSNQSLFTQSAWIDNYFTAGDLTQPRLSLGLFGTNLTYNGGFNAFNSNPADYANFYRTEQRMFAGNDFDVTTPDPTGWKGFGHYVPVRSVVNTLPFDTYFTVGQGRIFANNGARLTKDWTDMAKQTLLPSWQWAKTGTAPVSIGFDFDEAYFAGNSLKLAGSLSGSNSATVKLYQTKLPITAATSFDVTYKMPAAGATNTQLLLYFSDNLNQPEALALGTAPDAAWNTRTFSLAAYAGRELAIIGVQATAATAVPAYQLNLGRFKVYNGAAVTAAPTVNFTASATTVLINQPVTFSNATTDANSYVWTFTGAAIPSSTAVHPSVSWPVAGNYTVKLRAQNAVGRDSLTRVSYITVVDPVGVTGNTALLFDGLTKYVDTGVMNLSGPAVSLECWVKPFAFKTASPFISSVVGMEGGGGNALVRLGDSGLPANRLQFVLSVGGVDRKLNSPTTLNANTWYHVAATYDGTAMKLYVDGVLDATINVTGAVVANGSFTFGRNYDATRSLNGSIDEVRAWTRALTAAEIATGSHLCTVPANAAGLEGYWKCNEAGGNITLDLTGHGHTGTLVNMIPSDWTTVIPTQCIILGVGHPNALANGLQLRLLENPVSKPVAEIQLRGLQGQPVRLQVFNTMGALVQEQQVKASGDELRASLRLPAAAGLYVVRASTPKGSVSVKVLKE